MPHTSKKRKEKDPQAVKPYYFDWSPFLDEGDTIVTSVVVVDTGLTKDSESNTATTVTVWLSGGTDGEIYNVRSHIETAAGIEDDFTGQIVVKHR